MHFMKEVDIMKKWTSPTIEELNLKHTATLVTGDELSGEEGIKDEWTCIAVGEDGNIHWEGQGGPGWVCSENNSWWDGSQ